MRLSTRSRYGLRLMIAVGVHSRPMQLKDIARFEKISEKYLSQIIIPLKSGGLINSVRGANGGYVLGRPAGSIRVRHIIELLEGDLVLVEPGKGVDHSDISTEGVAGDVWKEMSAYIKDYLDAITLENIIDKYMEQQRNRGVFSDFSI